MVIVGYIAAVVIGLSLGMIGGGGSILTVPVLVYAFGYEPKDAIAMSLAVVGVAAVAGSVQHWRLGNLRFKTGFFFGGFSMLGAFLSSRFVSPYLSGGFQLILFSITMLFAAVFMFRDRPPKEKAADSPAALALLGILVGAFTGLVGVGGGFVLVPTLVLLAGLPMNAAVGTSLAIIAMNSVAGVVGYSGTLAIPWEFVVGFAALTLVGIFVGTALGQRVSHAALKKGFSVFLIVVGIFVFYKSVRETSLGEGHKTDNFRFSFPAELAHNPFHHRFTGVETDNYRALPLRHRELARYE
ncbi:MAG: sulfite exporter TauE/SafE family protein [Bdellovibrionaceae bacterium]|nr:sulfite exporter TauE/SafE family protein [Pseudobdellovibrionaceae bacterium]